MFCSKQYIRNMEKTPLDNQNVRLIFICLILHYQNSEDYDPSYIKDAKHYKDGLFIIHKNITVGRRLMNNATSNRRSFI